MPQDEMFVPTKHYFGRELYGDTLYEPKKEVLPFDSKMYSVRPEIPGENNYPPESASIFGPIHQAKMVHDFNRIISTDPKFANFSCLDYLSFSVHLSQSVAASRFVPPFESPAFSTIIVENDYMKGLFNPSAQTRAYCFVPLELMELERTEGYKLINKVLVYNNSNPLTQTVMTGAFRTPVAITRDDTFYLFDPNNTEIYNHDWWLIKMMVPASHFVKK